MTETAAKKSKRAPKKAEKDYRIRLRATAAPGGRRNMPMSINIRGVDTEVFTFESTEGSVVLLSIIGVDGARVYTVPFTAVLDCVAMGFLIGEEGAKVLAQPSLEKTKLLVVSPPEGNLP